MGQCGSASSGSKGQGGKPVRGSPRQSPKGNVNGGAVTPRSGRKAGQQAPPAAPAAPRVESEAVPEIVCDSPREKGEIGGMSYQQRRELARTTHFTVSEIEVLCKHFSDLSASQQDDGVIDKGEWRGAFRQTDRLDASRNTEGELGMRKASSSLFRQVSQRQSSYNSLVGSPTKSKPTVSASVVEDSFVNLPSMFLDRMFSLFDGDGNMEIDLEEFIRGLSVFSTQGTAQEKIAFAFRLYDIDADGYISREELRSVLIGSLKEVNEQNASSSVGMSPEVLERMIDETFGEADTNGDGRIDKDEFAAMVGRHPDIISNINFRASILSKGLESLS